MADNTSRFERGFFPCFMIRTMYEKGAEEYYGLAFRGAVSQKIRGRRSVMRFSGNLRVLLNGKTTALAAAGFSFLVAASVWAQQAVASAARPVPVAPAAPAISAGDTAWVLTSAALVLLMTPGLAFFYGGMVRKKNVMATILQSFFLVALISVQWVIWGYSLAFGNNGSNYWGGWAGFSSTICRR